MTNPEQPIGRRLATCHHPCMRRLLAVVVLLSGLILAGCLDDETSCGSLRRELGANEARRITGDEDGMRLVAERDDLLRHLNERRCVVP